MKLGETMIDNWSRLQNKIDKLGDLVVEKSGDTPIGKFFICFVKFKNGYIMDIGWKCVEDVYDGDDTYVRINAREKEMYAKFVSFDYALKLIDKWAKKSAKEFIAEIL